MGNEIDTDLIRENIAELYRQIETDKAATMKSIVRALEREQDRELAFMTEDYLWAQHTLRTINMRRELYYMSKKLVDAAEAMAWLVDVT